MDSDLLLPLSSPAATLPRIGGKGAALARMAAAGLPVPEGVVLTTAAYRRVVAHAGLADALADAARDDADPERSAAAIAGRFADAALPDDVLAALRSAAAALGEVPLAVRSSATAEDLPGLSFAGQQETVLGVRGEVELIAALRRCWASLWGARAIAYRRHMQLADDALAMAVVVQRLVPAEVAGVLFTADPATGDRERVLVNAAYGLGEAVVASEVTPDAFVLDRRGAVQETALGAKATRVVLAERGTEARAVDPALRERPAIGPGALAELVALALRVESLFGHVPQDIEWALAEGRAWLLQARPITRLPPPPLREVRWEPPIPGSAWIRRQVVEHLPGPVSPLFADLYLGEALEAGIRDMQAAMGVPRLVAERLIESPRFTTVNGFAYSRADLQLRWWTPPVLGWALAVGLGRLLRDAGIRYWRDDGLPTYRAELERWQRLDLASADDATLLRGVRALAFADARYWWACTLAVGTAKTTEDLLARFLTTIARRPDLSAGAFLRGFPSRTLAAQDALEAIAARVREGDALRRRVLSTPPQRLLATLARDPSGAAIAAALADYLRCHGHAIYDLDFAEPTQVDAPLPVLVSLRDMVQRTGDDVPGRLQALARERDALTESTARALGPARRGLFRRLVALAQRAAPHREEALYHVGAAWPLLRRLALELGRRRVVAGDLELADDVFFATQSELAAPAPGLAARARERRLLRAARRRLHAPAAVPTDFTLKLGPFDLSGRETQRRNAESDAVLRGFAVSPGRVRGPACVITSPDDFGAMRPGAILVCPTTTPAWTPLFARASGLVTDIGGVLAHGSIVAREYGLPAVMGTGDATRRISTGQILTVDGDAGLVTLHPPEPGRSDA